MPCILLGTFVHICMGGCFIRWGSSSYNVYFHSFVQQIVTECLSVLNPQNIKVSGQVKNKSLSLEENLKSSEFEMNFI